MKVSKSAYAYVKGLSILDNANYHLKCTELYKLDLKDFFSNISIYQVEKIFTDIGYTRKLSYQLATLCCCYNVLPQGACTSPKICNLICREMDQQLLILSDQHSLKYSRYADDLCFSGNQITGEFVDKVGKIVIKNGFEENGEKTILKRKGQRKIITGLCISGEKVRVLKRVRRNFRKNAYYLLLNKENDLNGVNRKLEPIYIDRIIGQANFILMIEPDNIYVCKVLPQIIALKNSLLF